MWVLVCEFTHQQLTVRFCRSMASEDVLRVYEAEDVLQDIIYFCENLHAYVQVFVLID